MKGIHLVFLGSLHNFICKQQLCYNLSCKAVIPNSQALPPQLHLKSSGIRFPALVPGAKKAGDHWCKAYFQVRSLNWKCQESAKSLLNCSCYHPPIQSQNHKKISWNGPPANFVIHSTNIYWAPTVYPGLVLGTGNSTVIKIPKVPPWSV